VVISSLEKIPQREITSADDIYSVVDHAKAVAADESLRYRI